MAKRKVKAKKKVKKTVKKKTAKRKKAKITGTRKYTPRKKKASGEEVVHGLHNKKLQIMADVKIVPCSAFGRDRAGFLYAYTRADAIYQLFRKQCQKHRLTIRKLEGITTDGNYGTGKSDTKIPCVRHQAWWEIRDADTGETEKFHGCGDGDNYIWSVMSAQTFAKKAALLDYFEVAWPQPTDYGKIVKDSFEKLGEEDFRRTLAETLPTERFPKKLKESLEEYMGNYFDKVAQKS